jgi:hypothetical protein
MSPAVRLLLFAARRGLIAGARFIERELGMGSPAPQQISPEEFRRRLERRDEHEEPETKRRPRIRPWYWKRPKPGISERFRMALEEGKLDPAIRQYLHEEGYDVPAPKAEPRSAPKAQAPTQAQAQPEARTERPKSKHPGVSWSAARGLWRARFRGKHLGYFSDEDQAAEAVRAEAERQGDPK